MNAERLNAMYQARHLLPEPGPEVVMELIAELRKAQDHLETAWGVIANAGVSLGDWNSMTPEWREAAERWRDEWHRMLSERHLPTPHRHRHESGPSELRAHADSCPARQWAERRAQRRQVKGP